MVMICKANNNNDQPIVKTLERVRPKPTIQPTVTNVLKMITWLTAQMVSNSPTTVLRIKKYNSHNAPPKIAVVVTNLIYN